MIKRFSEKANLIVIGLFLLVYILPLGVRPMVIPDETRYAEIPREMIASGDWVAPHLNGLRYFEKPVLGYWLDALSLLVFGENAFAVRFPSAIATGFGALLVFMLAKGFGGDRFVGVLASVLFLTCFEVMGIGIFSTLDAMFSLFVTGTVACFLLACSAVRRSRRELLMLFLSGIFCGLAFLTKGFLALALPVLIVVPFLCWERRAREMFRLSWLPLLTALVVILPWAIAVHLREGDFWRYFFWEEHIKRFSSVEAQHPAPPWYFLMIFPVVAMPLTFIIPAGIAGFRKQHLKDPLLRFSLCWFFLPFLFFSASRGKLGTYILPCFPPLAILLAVGLDRYLAEGREKLFKWGVMLLAALVSLFVLGVVGLPFFDFGITPYARAWQSAGLIMVLVGFVLLLLCSLRGRDRRKRLLFFACAPVPLLVFAHFLIPDKSLEHKVPGPLLVRNADRVLSGYTIVSHKDLTPAVCWFYKRDDVYHLKGSDELMYGLTYNDAAGRMLTRDMLQGLMLQSSERGSIILVLKAWSFAEITRDLPPPIYKDSNGRDGFVFAQY